MPDTHMSGDILKWGAFSFGVKPGDIAGIQNLALTGSCETEEKESGGEKYVKLKNRKPFDFSVKVVLNAHLTSDVKGKALKLAEAASKGESNYLYIGNEKLFTPKFLLTSAKVGKVTIAAGNEWYSLEADLTFKQGEKGDGTAASSSKKKKRKKSVKGGGANKNDTSSFWKDVKDKCNDAMKTINSAKAKSRKMPAARDAMKGKAVKVMKAGGSARRAAAR